MLRATILVTISALVPAVASAQSIEGVWRLTGGETIGGPDAETRQYNGGLLVYTDSHFVWALDINVEPRPIPGESASDADVVAAIQGYSSNAGTYEVDGRTIRYHRTTTLNPVGSLPQNQPLERQIVRLTRNELVTGLTDENGVTTTLRYERVE